MGSRWEGGDDVDWGAEARRVMDDKAKPPGSLGRLEDWAVRLCELQETVQPSLDRATLLVFAADHGVTKDSAVSAYPREVTAAVFKAIAAGKAACSVMAAALDCHVALWDVGVDADVAHVTAANPNTQLVHYKIRDGTSSFLAGPAMTPAELDHALAVGMVAVLAACGDQASCVRLPLQESSSGDEASPVPAFGWRNQRPGGKRYVNHPPEDDLGGLTRQPPESPESVTCLASAPCNFQTVEIATPEGSIAEGGQFRQPGSSSSPSGSPAKGNVKRGGGYPITASSNGMLFHCERGEFCDGAPLQGLDGLIRHCDLNGANAEGMEFRVLPIDERSPPGVSQRCAHCGMPTRPSGDVACSGIADVATPPGPYPNPAPSPDPNESPRLTQYAPEPKQPNPDPGDEPAITPRGSTLRGTPGIGEGQSHVATLMVPSPRQQPRAGRRGGTGGTVPDDDEVASLGAAADWRDDLPRVVDESRDDGAGRVGEGAETRRHVICVGEIGIGNTTAASAVLAALTSLPADQVCGAGTGVDEEGLRRKQQAVADGLAVNADLVSSGPKGILQAVGGLEIAAMAGAYLGCAQLNVPAVVDGFISSVAALAALHLDARVARVLFWSHVSAERGARATLNAAGSGALPVLDMGLRLGEGTGALLALPILRAAAALMCNMASLDECMQL